MAAPGERPSKCPHVMSSCTCRSHGQRSFERAHEKAPAATEAPYKHRRPLQKAPCVCITQCITPPPLPSPRPQYGTGKPDRRNKNRLVLKQYPTWVRSQYFPHSYQTILGYALVYRRQAPRSPSFLPFLLPAPSISLTLFSPSPFHQHTSHLQSPVHLTQLHPSFTSTLS